MAWAGIAADPLKSSLAAKSQSTGGGLTLALDAPLFENPAHGWSPTGRLLLQNQTLLGDIHQTLFVYSFPNTYYQDQWGLTLLLLNVADLLTGARDEYGHISFTSGTLFFYDYRVLALSYGKAISSYLRLGANLKYYSQAIEYAGSGNGLGLDLAASYYLSDHSHISAVFRNWMLNSFKWDNGSQDQFESYLQLAAWQELVLFDYPLNLTVGFDLEATGIPLHAGVEWGPKDTFALRAGFDQSLQASGGGTRMITDLTLGVGLKVDRFSADYAYHPYAGFSEYASHIFSLAYEFGI